MLRRRSGDRRGDPKDAHVSHRRLPPRLHGAHTHDDRRRGEGARAPPLSRMQAAIMKEFQHPFIVRFTHWVNFAALAIMVLSGLRIYNASPFFPFRIPADLTLGGWL